MKKMIDVPSGWRYGFPREIKDGESLKELLEKSGYPKDQIDFAMQYTRHWIEEEDAKETK